MWSLAQKHITNATLKNNFGKRMFQKDHLNWWFQNTFLHQKLTQTSIKLRCISASGRVTLQLNSSKITRGALHSFPGNAGNHWQCSSWRTHGYTDITNIFNFCFGQYVENGASEVCFNRFLNSVSFWKIHQWKWFRNKYLQSACPVLLAQVELEP